jgi:hypothetical protein
MDLDKKSSKWSKGSIMKEKATTRKPDGLWAICSILHVFNVVVSIVVWQP